VNTDTETGSKMIEELNNIESESDLSLQVISDISEKDTTKLNTLSENNKEQIEKLTETAIKNADASEESAQLIAKVVAVASDELVNKVVEEVSKSSTEEKQTLSAQVLKAIVDTEPNKLDIIEDDVKDTMIKQTIESAQNQQEGIGVQQTQDMTSIVSDIIVNSNTETGSKMIEELNNSSTDIDNDLSLQVISAISEKDTTKLNTLSENNKEQIEKLTETAIKNADASEESADLIAKVVANASDELVNKVVEEVSKNSTEENQALSAKVMKSIVETNPEKIETLSDENKETMITQTIEAAKNQAEGTSTDEVDLTNTIAEIVTKSDTGTAAKVLETLEEVSNESESKLSLNVVSNLTKQENYEEKMEILSVTSSVVEQSITRLVEKAVENASSKEDLELISDIVENSKGTIADKVINSANTNKESKKKISEVIVKVIEKNPEKAVEIIEKNKNTNTVLETIKTKIEKGEAISTDDFEEVFDQNVSPN
jgi:phosphoserine phosphatase